MAPLTEVVACQWSQLPQKGKWKSIAQEIGTGPEALHREIARRKKVKRVSMAVELRTPPVVLLPSGAPSGPVCKAWQRLQMTKCNKRPGSRHNFGSRIELGRSHLKLMQRDVQRTRQMAGGKLIGKPHVMIRHHANSHTYDTSIVRKWPTARCLRLHN